MACDASRTTTKEYVIPAITLKSPLNASERSLKTPPSASMVMKRSDIPMTSLCL